MKTETLEELEDLKSDHKHNLELMKGLNDKIEGLKRELEQERRINAEIKARFVKCNICTQEMKDKCLMFSENLCEGERCEELVDLMALVSKSDLQKENEQLKAQIEKVKHYLDYDIPHDLINEATTKIWRMLK